MSKFATVVDLIREQWNKHRPWPSCEAYDHRAYLPAAAEGKWLDDCWSDYAAFKALVASVVLPGRIVEIGTCWGISARAFLHARPEARYAGYDSGADDERIFDAFAETFKDFRATLHRADSGALIDLPPCDLVHVDGAHDWGHAFHDVLLALRAAPWVLVDDCHDSQVAAAALTAAFTVQPGDMEWAYFEDTYSGDILLHRKDTVTRGLWNFEGGDKIESPFRD